jgi:hypothetical protein
MTAKTDTHIPPQFVQVALEAFGPISKTGTGEEHKSTADAIIAAFGEIKDRRQVHAAVWAYRRYYGERSGEELMRLMLEAARDWSPKQLLDDNPSFTGRSESCTVYAETLDELEPAAMAMAREDFGHSRLVVSSHYSFYRSETGPAPGMLKASIAVRELAPPDPDA